MISPGILKRGALVGMMSLFAGLASAQTVTVDASLGSPNNTTTFNNLQDAIGSFRASASTGGAGVNNGNVLPNIVNVISTTPVTGTANFDALAAAVRPELIIMDEDLIVQGQGGLGVFAGSRIASSTTNGAFVWRQKFNLTLNDMAIIPADTTPAALCYFKATQEAGDAPVVTLNNCVITGNNGSNQPVTVTGLDNPDLSAAGVITLANANDGLYAVSRVENGSLTVNLNNTVISAFSKGGNSDGIIMFMQGTTTDIINTFVNVNAGCVISEIPRFGIQNDYGGFLNINGSLVDPVIMMDVGADGIWTNSDPSGATQAVVTKVNYANILNVKGTAIKEQETGGRGFVDSVTNTKIANTTGPAIALYSKGALPPGGYVSNTVTIDNVVVHNNTIASTPADYDNLSALIASPSYQTTNRSNRAVTVSNSTLTGGAGQIGIYNSSDGAYTVSNTVVSLTGSNALSDDFLAVSPGVITEGTGNTFGAVSYANTTDPSLPTFLVPLTSSVSDWSVY